MSQVQAMRTQQRAVPLVGTSPAMVDLKAEIERVARSDAKVLITGESGSGKELVAQAVHAGSSALERDVRRRELRRIARNAPRVGAVRPRQGQLHRRLSRQARASSSWPTTGTMFLDEIGEMTLRMQGLLLRFLETGELQKVGADRVVGPRRRPRHRRDQSQPARHDRPGHVPRRPVLPPERHSPHRCRRCATAARTSRSSPITSSITSRRNGVVRRRARSRRKRWRR